MNKLPNNTGVYTFLDNKKGILYIGKATNLKSRVGSYFQGRDERGMRIALMVAQVADIKIQETDSVLEALILESNLIKKFQPKYNVERKDDKSFSYVTISKEIYPRVEIVRETNITSPFGKGELGGFEKLSTRKNPSPTLPLKKGESYASIFGPYTSKKQLEIALKIIRKIFPYHSLKQKTEKGCLDFQLGRCPGPYADAISKTDYAKNIRGIKMVLEGKKKNLLKKMEKEMQVYSKKNEFEKAAELRNKIFSLQHIQDVALISEDKNPSLTLPLKKGESLIPPFEKGGLRGIFRIEAYDISNISGQYAVGSMVVFFNGEPDKSQYRKFKIKTVAGSNDVGMMAEVLFRRFRHNEWPKPDLILLDGGKGHLNMAEKVLKELNLRIPLVAIAKGPTRKNLKFKILNLKFDQKIQSILNDNFLVKNIMDEAHRFAISYHKKLRKKNFLVN